MNAKDLLNLLEGKYINILKNKDDLIKKYNTMTKKHRKKGSRLSDLSDRKFFIFLVGKTFKFGRPFEDAVGNAILHMDN